MANSGIPFAVAGSAAWHFVQRMVATNSRPWRNFVAARISLVPELCVNKVTGTGSTGLSGVDQNNRRRASPSAGLL